MQKWARLLYQPSLPLYGDTRITGSKAHIEISRRAAAEGIVLLENNGVLPLSAQKPVALLGKACVDYVKGGGGSGDVHCAYIHSLYDGIRAKDVPVYEPLVTYYQKEMAAQYAAGRLPGMTAEPPIPGDLLREAASFSDTAVVVIGRYSGEGWDRSSIEYTGEYNPWPEETSMPKLSGVIFPDGDFYLTREEKAMVAAAQANFDNVIAVLNIGGVIDMRWLKDEKISAAIYMGQGGMEGGDAAADVLFGDVNPSGHLVDTFAGTLEDYPSTADFHASFDYVDYKEDIYVGYRYFETLPGAAQKVIYPFGYGLTYTQFTTELISAAPFGTGEEAGFCVTARVTNTGTMPGKEVVQLYYSAPQGKLGKPRRALGDFVKTGCLAPGGSEIVTLSLRRYGMASYDDLGKIQEAAYVLEAGIYEFYLGSNVRDAAKIDYSWHNEKDIVVQQLSHRAAPVELAERMCADGSFEKLPTSAHRDINACIFPKMVPGTEEGLLPMTQGTPIRSMLEVIREGARPLSEAAEGKMTIDDFTAQLTDEELIALVGGQPNTGVANTFGFGNLAACGVPNAMTADGPAGVRIAPETGILTTAFPCATTIACTWNRALAEEIGFAGGEELRENNLAVWLTPAVNIHRNPMCGRNFEYYSEDPYLTGRMAAAMVRGIQKNRVGASVKHFACNNKETNRKNSDSRVSERALREIYLKAFEIIVREAAPYTIMSSYNAVNGHRASECKDLLTGILRDEWGFTGFVTSDWWTRGEHYKELCAGNDLKMACGFPDRLQQAMDMGALDRETLIRSARRILEVILRFD